MTDEIKGSIAFFLRMRMHYSVNVDFVLELQDWLCHHLNSPTKVSLVDIDMFKVTNNGTDYWCVFSN